MNALIGAFIVGAALLWNENRRRVAIAYWIAAAISLLAAIFGL